MDDLRTRLDTLEHQTTTLTQHARRVTRQLRWWRGLACGLLALALLVWGLPVSTAQEDTRGGGLASRLAALEHKLRYLTVTSDAEAPPEVVITGANLRIVNGLGRTDCTDEQGGQIPDCPNGVGNLLVGYNEPRNHPENPDVRTGSHNVVVGRFHNFSRFGGLVVGDFNTISGDFAVAIGGEPIFSLGGRADFNTASGDFAVVIGGVINSASGRDTVVIGGAVNTASGDLAVVSGGQNRTAASDFDWVAGPLFADE